MSSSLLHSPSMAVRIIVASIVLILFTANLTITSAQQQQEEQQQLMTSQPTMIQNVTATLYESTKDSFRVHVPEGWIIEDMNNTGYRLLEEVMQGYGVLAQLCPQEQAVSDANGRTLSSCAGAQEVIHIVRYPNLGARLGFASEDIDNITPDDILPYHIQKLQEVGYLDINVVDSTDTTVNITNAHTNQTIATAPAKLVEMTYGTNLAPNETKAGYFILTATDATPRNLGMITGYSLLYEVSSAAAPEITPSVGLSPLPTVVRQVFDPFELIAGEEEAEEAEQIEEDEEQTVECDPSYPDVCIPPPPPDLDCGDYGVPEDFRVLPPDPHNFDRDNDGIGCESGITVGGTSAADDYDETADDDDNGERTNDDDDDDDNNNTREERTTNRDGITVGGTSAADDYDETADDDDNGERTNYDECDGITVGGTSAADDYDCIPDAE